MDEEQQMVNVNQTPVEKEAKERCKGHLAAYLSPNFVVVMYYA